MADFNKAIDLVLKNEGKYSNDPDDSGLETYCGVSRKNFPNWKGWIIIDALKHQPNFPANLDLDVVLQQDINDFYKENFWTPIKGDDIVNQTIANSIFDFAVNAGVVPSSKFAQRVVGVTEDGIIGKNTIAKINEFDPEKFVPLFIIEKVKLYIRLCIKNPNNKKFFFGWIVRTINN